mgnify:CR=1 FL=1
MKYGFIGCGNMGGAVARAVCKGAGSGDVLLANRTPAKAQALADELGCACGTNEEVAGICDFIFLGVKPQMMADMLDELTPTLEARAESRPFVLVTMAAGLSMQQIRQMAGSGYPIIRMMPNTPVALGDGIVDIFKELNVDQIVDGGQRAVDARAVDIVDEDDRAVKDASLNVLPDGLAVAVFPVLRVN